MPRNHYLLTGIIYFCSNLIFLFASIYESTIQYKLAYLYPPGFTLATSVKPPCALDLEYFHPQYLDLPPGCARETIFSAVKEISTTPPLPNVLSAQDFRKLGFVYITVFGLANQVISNTGSWRPLATAVNYLVKISPIVYMAFQAQPTSPVRVQLDSGPGYDNNRQGPWHATESRLFRDKLLEELNQHTVTSVIADGLLEKVIDTQHEGLKTEVNSDDWLEVWAI
ncbi:hypothetical protein DSO57_1024374 [Entomophthora muscae]|uniref:Uncharacterized protein n=1 Tax=Entomophthora muscae TaxID=34485 RepID=A0ACC2S4R5_9FUNG|nr:hypothetical protein DSO57_1024374 [Entomophthora muscae]